MSDNASGTRGLRFTGLLVHLVSTRFAPVARFQNRAHSALFARFGGSRFASWLGRPVFRLTVVGRKSGVPRSVVLLRLHDGDDLVVTGSNGGNAETPNWWHNLIAAGAATAEYDGADHPVTVRVVTDEGEYDRRARALADFYPDFETYRRLSPRTFPIAVLSPAGA